MAKAPASWAPRLEQEDGDEILKELSASLDDADGDSLQEYFETAAQQKLRKLWAAISPKVNIAVGKLKNCPSNDPEVQDTMTILSGCIRAIKQAFPSCQQRAVHLRPIVLSMSDLLGDLDDESESSVAFKSSLSSLCEVYIISHEAGYEELVPTAITYLLRETLRIDAKESMLKRLVAIKDCFQLLDFSSSSQSFCRDLLMRCFVHPSFIKCAEARKLLADLLAISDGVLCEPACQVIKVQVSTGSTLLGGQYGGIFYRAWKDHASSSAIFRKNLHDCLQDLVHEAIHSDGPKRFKGLRILIKAFHDVNRNEAFNQLLVEIFDPIIWRSLRCANAIVRSQAAVVFLDVFPLQRSSSNPEECDQLLQKQFDQLISLLKDGDHRVRSIATTGVCHILREYWDMLPPGTVHNILKYVFDTLAVDASSANVRYSVIMGIQDLLQQPLSHRALKGLLPVLRNYIHDKSEKVRVAFVKLLDEVKMIQDIVFYEIVPIEHLLARLAEDRNSEEMVLAMTGLLLNSYFPQTSGGDRFDKVHRCLQFLQDNSLAAEAFYSHIYKFVSVGAITKLSAMLFNLLLIKPSSQANEAPAEEPGKKTGKRRRGNQKPITVAVLDESQDSSATIPPLIQDPATYLRVLRLVVAILSSIKTEIPNHGSSLELILKYFTVKNLSQLMVVTLGQSSHVDFMVASGMQLVAIIGQLMQSSAGPSAKQAFSLEFIIDSIYLRALSASQNEVGKRLLANGLVECIRALDLQTEMLAEVQQALVNVIPVSKKSHQDGMLTLEHAAVVLRAFVDYMCRSIAEDFGEQTNEMLQSVWNALRVVVERIFSKSGDNKKGGPLVLVESEMVANLDMVQAWLTYAAFATSSAAISSLLPGEEHRVDNSLNEVIAWMDKVLPSPLAATATLPVATTKFYCNLLGARLLVLADSIDLLPVAAVHNIVVAVAKDIYGISQAVESEGNVWNENRSATEDLLRKVLVVCDRLCAKWDKLKALLPVEVNAPLRNAVTAFISCMGEYVAPEDQAMNAMFDRCVKVTGSQPAASPLKAPASVQEQNEPLQADRDNSIVDPAVENIPPLPQDSVEVSKGPKRSQKRGVRENLLLNI